jgi:hypothetical protein
MVYPYSKTIVIESYYSRKYPYGGLSGFSIWFTMGLVDLLISPGYNFEQNRGVSKVLR